MCTYNGYYATFDEKKRGSLEKGKIADMVILSRNPYRIRPEELNKIKVEKTILKGKEFVSEKKSVFKTILKGMIRNGIC
jgi:predicted amidohydrolase YtcJ